jgi:casein kinase 1
MDEYTIYGVLGKGNFGKVYKAIQNQTNIHVAIKMDRSATLIEREHILYRHLWEQIVTKQIFDLFIPRVYYYIIEHTRYILVLERLGTSLDKLYDRYNGLWTNATLYWIVVKVLTLLKGIHQAGIIHRDVKPDNFAIGYTNQNDLYIFDFGLSGKYHTDEGSHHPFSNGYSIIGTTRYASIHNHLGFKQSRRDDLESMWYMMYYLWYGELPWIHLSDSQKVLRIKNQYNWKTSKIAEDMKQFLFYIKNLKYDDDPDYDYWIRQFQLKSGDRPEWTLDIVTVDEKKTKKNILSKK